MDAAGLFEEHHEALLRYLVRLTGDPDLARDAAQEAFVRLVTHPPRDERPRAWLFTVATNLVREWSNTRRRRLRLLDAGAGLATAADPPPGPDAAAESAELRATVSAALAGLSARERTVLLMREEGFRHREIAEVVGATTASVGTMIARALDKLADRLPLDSDVMQ
jgi:RNA polymerase sigma factor (sigma-70 family)